MIKKPLGVVLINPDYMIYADPPIGLCYLASYIREKNKNDFDVKILDQLSHLNIEKEIKKSKPEIIGFTAVSLNYYRVRELAKRIKKISPDSILVIGGIHITLSPNSFENSPFHTAVRGEGEITFSRLLKSIKKNKGINIKELKKIKGLLLRTSNKKILNTGLPELIENLDELPLPARNLLNSRYYSIPSFLSKDGGEPFGSIMTSRGCPYNCKFCSSSSFWKRRIRFFSAKRVADEIEVLYKKYNYDKIYIYDDLFCINKERIKKIIDLLEKKEMLGKITFHMYGRADVFDEEIAKLLKKLNVVSVSFGFESGSQKVLTYLKGEGITVEDNRKAIKIAKKYGFDICGFFMVGSPYETLDDMEKTYNFIKEDCSDNFIICQTIPFPATEIWDYAIKNKIVSPDYYDKEQKEFLDLDTDILLSKDVSKNEFEKMFHKIKSFYINSNKNNLLRNISSLKLKHLSIILSPVFFKKLYNIRKPFIKRIKEMGDMPIKKD